MPGPEQFLVTQEEYAQAYEVADEDIVNSLRKAIENVRRYHQEQKPNSWITYRNHGSILGQSVIPLDRVGVYVPGGTAAYPSSVVMNVMPAKVAGVKEIIMMAPPSRDGKLNPYVLIAAKEAGVDAIYKVGGAQAIAAMAFGTETIPKVDKITGPGNIFVTLAKKAVYGHCDIDMLAGPSEILIVADKTARVDGEPFCRLEDGRAEGCAAGHVYGTYLHGLFDTGEATARLADLLCKTKGIDPAGAAPLSHRAFQEREFDRLAEAVRAALDMDAIYRMMEG